MQLVSKFEQKLFYIIKKLEYYNDLYLRFTSADQCF